jgi:hypothetical protein
VWKKQSSQLTFRAGRFAGRLLCFVDGTYSPSLRSCFDGRTGRAIKAPLACPHKAQRKAFPQIAEKTILTRKQPVISHYLVTITRFFVHFPTVCPPEERAVGVII